MNTEQILTRTFADHEDLAPDADHTLDGVHQQLRTRRRRRVTGSLTAAGAAATVAAVAIGASVIGGGPATPARSAQPAGPGRPPQQGPAVSAGDWGFLTFGPGWLPAGATQTLAMHSAWEGSGDGQRLAYEVHNVIPSQTTTQIELTLGVDPQPDGRSGSRYGTARPTTINGRSGTEWSGSSGYLVSYRTASGGPVAVKVAGDPDAPPATAALRTLGRQIATQLRFNQRTALRTSFTLSYVPAGYVIRGVTLQRGTSYVLGRPGSKNGDTPYISVREIQGGREQIFPRPGGKGVPVPTAGHPVNNHQAWLVTGRDFPVVYVEHYRPGWSLAVSGSAITSDFIELYRIAGNVHAT